MSERAIEELVKFKLSAERLLERLEAIEYPIRSGAVEQLRLAYNATKFTSFTVGADGGLTIGGTLGKVTLTGNLTLGATKQILGSLGVGCHVYANANIVTATGDYATYISFTTEVRDDDTMWAVGDPTKIYATRAGWYYCYLQLLWAANATGVRQAVISTSTSNHAIQENNIVANVTLRQNVSLLVYLAAGASVRFRGYQTSGGNLNLTYQAGFSTYAGMIRIA